MKVLVGVGLAVVWFLTGAGLAVWYIEAHIEPRGLKDAYTSSMTLTEPTLEVADSVVPFNGELQPAASYKVLNNWK